MLCCRPEIPFIVPTGNTSKPSLIVGSDGLPYDVVIDLLRLLGFLRLFGFLRLQRGLGRNWRRRWLRRRRFLRYRWWRRGQYGGSDRLHGGGSRRRDRSRLFHWDPDWGRHPSNPGRTRRPSGGPNLDREKNDARQAKLHHGDEQVGDIEVAFAERRLSICANCSGHQRYEQAAGKGDQSGPDAFCQDNGGDHQAKPFP